MAPETDAATLVDLERRLREQVRIVLVRPQHPGNVGSTARAMKNMGLRRLVIVDPPALDMERARWMATSARDLLDEVTFAATVAEAVADCELAVATTSRGRRWRWPVWTPTELATRCFELAGPVAVLFGREDFGLDNEALACCQALIRIPTAGMASMNLSQAVLLVCARFFDEARARGWDPEEAPRQGRRSSSPRPHNPPPYEPEPVAPLGAQAPVVALALEVLEGTPYMNGKSQEQVQVMLTNMLQRARPTQAELNILKGMLKKTRWQISEG